MDRKSKTSLAQYTLLFNNQLASPQPWASEQKGAPLRPHFGRLPVPRYCPRIWKKRMMDSIPR
jgi:hypothetical protein